MAVQFRSAAETKFAELEQFFANSRDIGSFSPKWLAERNHDGIWDPARPFFEETPALERKDRTPELIEPDRNNRCIGVARDQFVPTLQPQQCSTPFELTFRKETHNCAFRNPFGCGADGGMGIPNIYGDAAEQPQDGRQQPLLIEFARDDKADGPWARDLQHDSVHPCDVIWQKQKAVGGQIFQTVSCNPVDAPRQWPPEKIERALRDRHGSHLYHLH